MKGIGVGMLVGGATALIGGTMKSSKKMNYKKMANNNYSVMNFNEFIVIKIRIIFLLQKMNQL